MSAWSIGLLATYAVVVNLWKLLHVVLFFYKPSRYFIGLSAAKSVTESPLVSVILAAKDEQGNVGDCVRSILQSEYKNFELIVVDDRSVDETSAEATDAFSGDPRAQLLYVDTLPSGWTGKMNAVRRGMELAKGELILVTDADTRHAPQALAAAVGVLKRRKAHLLSLIPRFENRSLFSRIVQPLVGAVLFFWKPLMWVNSRKHAGVAIAWGGFLLVRRKTLDEIGGFESVRDRLAADIAIASRMKQARRRIRVFHAPDLVSTHLYASSKEVINGWTRLLRLTANGSAVLPIVSLVLIFTFALSAYPVLAAAVGNWLGGAGSAFWIALGVMATLHLLFQMMFLARLYRISGSNPLYTLGHLPAVLITVGLLIRVLIRRRGAPVTWRGTSYHVTDTGQACAHSATACGVPAPHAPARHATRPFALSGSPSNKRGSRS